MAGVNQEDSTYAKARKIMERWGEFTLEQVYPEIGALFPASSAAATFRMYRQAETNRGKGKTLPSRTKTYSTEEMVTLGRRWRVRGVIARFLKTGIIEKIDPTHYIWVGGEKEGRKRGVFTSLVKKVVEEGGECTLDQILTVLRDQIPSTMAISAYLRFLVSERKRRGIKTPKKGVSMEKYAELGRRLIVRRAAKHLASRGALRKVRNGVYARVDVTANDKH